MIYRYEYLLISTGAFQTNNTQINAQTFTIGTVGDNWDFKIYSVKLKLFRVGNPGIVTISLRNVAANGRPTGEDLAVATIDGDTFSTASGGTWYEIVLSPKYKLSASKSYAILLDPKNAVGASTVGWRWDMAAPYTGGDMFTSNNGGVSWIPNGIDACFEVWGGGAISKSGTVSTKEISKTDIPAGIGDIQNLIPEGVNGIKSTILSKERVGLEL